jgi:hypothetical protein
MSRRDVSAVIFYQLPSHSFAHEYEQIDERVYEYRNRTGRCFRVGVAEDYFELLEMLEEHFSDCRWITVVAGGDMSWKVIEDIRGGFDPRTCTVNFVALRSAETELLPFDSDGPTAAYLREQRTGAPVAMDLEGESARPTLVLFRQDK